MENFVKLVLMINSLTIVISPWAFAIMVKAGIVDTHFDLLIFVGLVILSEFERRR